MSNEKYIPNTFQTPNAIIDELMDLLTDSEFRVLMFMVRHILGWQNTVQLKRARISQSVLESGYSYMDDQGNTIQKRGCGVGRSAIKTALNNLVKYRIVKKIGKATNDGQMWELVLLTQANPDIAGLEKRAEKKQRRSQRQTEKARKLNPKNNAELTGGTVQQIPHRGDSSTDTQGDSSTDTQGDSSTDTNETHRNPSKPISPARARKSAKSAPSKQLPIDEGLREVAIRYKEVFKPTGKPGKELTSLQDLLEHHSKVSIIMAIDACVGKDIKSPINYLVTILNSDDHKAKVAEASKVVPCHQSFKPLEKVSDDDRQAALKVLQDARKAKEKDIA